MLNIRCLNASFKAGLSTMNKLQSRKLKNQMLQSTQHNLQIRSLSSNKTTDLKEKVYYGVLTPQIRAVKVFSLTTSIAGIIAQPILINQAATLGGTSIVIAMCGFIGFFTFVTPLLLHIITKKYVTTIEYDKALDKYIAYTISFFLTKKKIEFKGGEVIVPDVPGMFTTFHVGKTALFVDPRLFENPDHYAKIMGYDKPMDFKLNLDDVNEKAKNIKPGDPK